MFHGLQSKCSIQKKYTFQKSKNKMNWIFNFFPSDCEVVCSDLETKVMTIRKKLQNDSFI